MAKMADADKLRAGKLDSAWVKRSGQAVWTSRMSDEGLHQVQSCETHSRRQPGELPR